MIQIQVVRQFGLGLAGADACPRCEEPIAASDVGFVAVRLPRREPIHFHLECYDVFAAGLVSFRSKVLPAALRQRVQ